MTNKDKTILFFKVFCALLWAGATVISGASVLNGDADAFVKVMAVITMVINLAIAGKFCYEQIIK